MVDDDHDRDESVGALQAARSLPALDLDTSINVVKIIDAFLRGRHIKLSDSLCLQANASSS